MTKETSYSKGQEICTRLHDVTTQKTVSLSDTIVKTSKPELFHQWPMQASLLACHRPDLDMIDGLVRRVVHCKRWDSYCSMVWTLCTAWHCARISRKTNRIIETKLTSFQIRPVNLSLKVSDEAMLNWHICGHFLLSHCGSRNNTSEAASVLIIIELTVLAPSRG
jgi:hypothetical protein